ncbi:MAG: protein-L-isoaspartate(D-aspartate) O-methyltransferase [Pirellulales bacterium]
MKTTFPVQISIRFFIAMSITFTGLIVSSAAVAKDPYEAARKQMVEDVVVGNGIKDPRVIRSLGETMRHEFVSAKQRNLAYYDMALPIGQQQTISSPFIVSYMTESLNPRSTDRVLEIGTGSGYQAAVLSPLVKDVFSIEIVPELGRNAAKVLKRLKYANVHTKVGDGYKGWPEHAPFDKIIVTCSPEKVPVPLVQQLKEGGKLVVPVGERYQQTLYLFTKKDGKLVEQALRPTLFVPMTGQAEFRREVKPNPLKPQVQNGNFEEPVEEHGHMPGWYYQRQFEVVKDTKSPVGDYHVLFKNEVGGRASMALQGFAVDGRAVKKLKVSAWVKSDGIFIGNKRKDLPSIAITFYDDTRRDLGRAIIGPFIGSQDWEQVQKEIRVPPDAREALFRIGLFGTVGELSFDDVKMEAVR